MYNILTSCYTMMPNDGHYMLNEVGTSTYLYYARDYNYIERMLKLATNNSSYHLKRNKFSSWHLGLYGILTYV